MQGVKKNSFVIYLELVYIIKYLYLYFSSGFTHKSLFFFMDMCLHTYIQ